MAQRIAQLKRRSEFLRVAAAGRKWAAPGLVLQAMSDDERLTQDAPDLRVGYTASKRVGGAVERNRAKRRLRATVARVMPEHAMPGHDYVVIARAATLTRPFDDLLRDLESALHRVGAHQSGGTARDIERSKEREARTQEARRGLDAKRS